MIELKDVTVAYGGRTVLERCSLALPDGSHTALMGPSGCGKTTVLRLILGIEKAKGGSVTVKGRTSCVFQEPRLLPERTALENINVVLSDRAETLPEARKWLDAVGLGAEGDKYPAALSGGMQQRIAVARALASGGDILLLDEPLKGCDPALKTSLTALLRDYAKDRTLLLVTHDGAEAAALTDRVCLVQDRKLILTDL